MFHRCKSFARIAVWLATDSERCVVRGATRVSRRATFFVAVENNAVRVFSRRRRENVLRHVFCVCSVRNNMYLEREFKRKWTVGFLASVHARILRTVFWSSQTNFVNHVFFGAPSRVCMSQECPGPPWST